MCNEDTCNLQGSTLGRDNFFPCFCELCLPKSPPGQRNPNRSCASKEQLNTSGSELQTVHWSFLFVDCQKDTEPFSVAMAR